MDKQVNSFGHKDKVTVLVCPAILQRNFVVTAYVIGHKRVLTDATRWNNPKNCELWRSEWAKVCNAHLSVEQQIDHRFYARQGKLEIPTIHAGANARKIDEKFQSGQVQTASWKVEEKQIIKKTKCTAEKDTDQFWKSGWCIITMEGAIK